MILRKLFYKGNRRILLVMLMSFTTSITGFMTARMIEPIIADVSTATGIPDMLFYAIGIASGVLIFVTLLFKLKMMK